MKAVNSPDRHVFKRTSMQTQYMYGCAGKEAANAQYSEEQGMSGANVVTKGLYRVLHYTITPLFMLLCIPNISMVIVYTAVNCQGNATELFHQVYDRGLLTMLMNIWLTAINQMTTGVVIVLIIFCLVQVILMKVLPGKRLQGPLTPNGYTPEYVDNGFSCYCVSLVLFGVLTLCLKTAGFTPSYVYDKIDGFLVATNIMGHCLCTLLLIKGLVAPSTPDSGSSGNILFDYYWGTDLYPNILGVDVKVFTNCRFGMTVWPLLCLIYAIRSYEVYGFYDSIWLSTLLQIIYISKFFMWESGYYQSIDIIMDRAGYMICWGCLCYVPAVYASVSLYLASNPVRLGPALCSVIFLAGITSIGINYWADYQRQLVRVTKGLCRIWGKSPQVIKAKYTLNNGEERSSLLLASGFWGLARHFNYVPEILLSFFWSVPALFSNYVVYFYTLYLALLLIHRAFRDDDKCRRKYGIYWEEYCKKVPYKMIPGLF